MKPDERKVGQKPKSGKPEQRNSNPRQQPKAAASKLNVEDVNSFPTL